MRGGPPHRARQGPATDPQAERDLRYANRRILALEEKSKKDLPWLHAATNALRRFQQYSTLPGTHSKQRVTARCFNMPELAFMRSGEAGMCLIGHVPALPEHLITLVWGHVQDAS
eukprot:853203-Alexandrium_andersonii.AAC.1